MSKEKLTAKQKAVLQLMSKGFTGQAIAYEPGLTIDTVKYHKRQIFKKLGASNNIT